MKQKSQIFLRFDYFLENKKPNQSGLEMTKFIYIFGLKSNFLAQGDLCSSTERTEVHGCNSRRYHIRTPGVLYYKAIKTSLSNLDVQSSGTFC